MIFFVIGTIFLCIKCSILGPELIHWCVMKVVPLEIQTGVKILYIYFFIACWLFFVSPGTTECVSVSTGSTTTYFVFKTFFSVVNMVFSNAELCPHWLIPHYRAVCSALPLIFQPPTFRILVKEYKKNFTRTPQCW
jgi:hypothetical protein